MDNRYSISIPTPKTGPIAPTDTGNKAITQDQEQTHLSTQIPGIRRRPRAAHLHPGTSPGRNLFEKHQGKRQIRRKNPQERRRYEADDRSTWSHDNITPDRPSNCHTCKTSEPSKTQMLPLRYPQHPPYLPLTHQRSQRGKYLKLVAKS